MHVAQAPLPGLLERVLQTCRADKPLEQEAMSWICHDPKLSSHVLRAVNSTANGFPRQLTSVQQSLRLLNPQIAQRIVTEAMQVPTEADLQRVSQAWRVSLKTAIYAEYLAIALQLPSEEEAFSAGMLHNIGDYVRAGYFSAEMQEIHDIQTSSCPVMQGVKLAQQWRFSESLQAVIRYHEQNQFIDEPEDLVMLVAIAQRLMADKNLSPAMFAWFASRIEMSEADFYTWRERFVASADDFYERRMRWIHNAA